MTEDAEEQHIRERPRDWAQKGSANLRKKNQRKMLVAIVDRLKFYNVCAQGDVAWAQIAKNSHSFNSGRTGKRTQMQDTRDHKTFLNPNIY